ncbi:MAG: Veg protein [Clostridia bacterium]|nr:Veg protein [Clostridia bacterium]
MIYKSDISSLRKDMEAQIGQKIIIKESPGKRSKPLEKEAVIEQAYPNYFRVKFDENDRRGSYNYTDIFTKSVEVQIFDGEQFKTLEPPAIISKKNRQEFA